MYPKIAVITINYATAENTIECVKSLQQQTYPALDIIVVDNASPDNSGKMLKKELEGICTVLLSKENLGFSYGNNLGLDYAVQHGAEYLLFINNDTVQDKDMVMNLYTACGKDTIVVPKTYYYAEPNVLWDVGGAISPLGRIYNRGIGETDAGQYDKPETVMLFTGHCLLMPVECVHRAGKWDERYFMYVEDTEYSMRLKEHGFHILYVPKAKLWHKVSGTSGGNANPKVMYYSIRNRLMALHDRKFPIICRLYAWLWIFWCEFRYRVRGCNAFCYASRAVKDYRRGVVGKVEFSNEE